MASVRERAALAGAASGLRSFSALAALALWSGHRGAISRPAVLAAAVGELVADKLPVTPARIAPGPLAVRIGTGALAGHRIAGPPGAASGAIAAAAASLAAYHARRAIGRRLGAPDAVIGVAEDALAVGLATLAARGPRARS